MDGEGSKENPAVVYKGWMNVLFGMARVASTCKKEDSVRWNSMVFSDAVKPKPGMLG